MGRYLSSIKLRMLAASSVGIAVLLSGVGFGLQIVYQQQLTQQYAAPLLAEANQWATRVSGDLLSQENALPKIDTEHQWRIWVGEAQFGPLDLLLEHPLEFYLDDAEQIIIPDYESENEETEVEFFLLLRKVFDPRSKHDVYLALARDDEPFEQSLEAFSTTLQVALIGLAGGLIALAWWQIAYGLAPFGQLRRSLKAVQEGADTVVGTFPSEVQPVIDDLNTLMAQQRAMLNTARNTAGDLAHGLKTPLAVLEVATQKSSSVDSEVVKAQASSMRRMVDHHLTRARAAAVARQPGLRVCVAERVSVLVRTLKTVHSSKTLSVVEDGDTALSVAVDPRDLDDILGNILDNAFKWAASCIDITWMVDQQDVILTIQDDGPGLSDAMQKTVLQRGQKLDEQVQGSGLGLSIVHAILDGYNGQLSFETAPRGGLSVVLRLPGTV